MHSLQKYCNNNSYLYICSVIASAKKENEEIEKKTEKEKKTKRWQICVTRSWDSSIGLSSDTDSDDSRRQSYDKGQWLKMSSEALNLRQWLRYSNFSAMTNAWVDRQSHGHLVWFFCEDELYSTNDYHLEVLV